jgi:hypothetical protein
VKSKVSKRRVKRNHLIRFSGKISPAAADQQVAFQKRRNGQWVAVGGVTRCAEASSPRTQDPPRRHVPRLDRLVGRAVRLERRQEVQDQDVPLGGRRTGSPSPAP